MKIFINALSARQGGGQTYLKHLLEKYPKGTGDTVILLTPDSIDDDFYDKKIFIRQAVSPLLVNNPFIRTFWENFVLPFILKKEKVDIMFCPGGAVGAFIPSSIKVVTTFQNMMPFDHKQRKKYPLGYMRFRNWLLEKKLLKSMIRSDLVIFISKYAEEVIKRVSYNQIKKSVIIPHGVNPLFRKKTSDTLPSWLPSEGYLLYVSILDVYKSQLEVIQAFDLFKKKTGSLVKLLLVGPEYAPYGAQVRELIEQLKLKNEIILKSAILNTELPVVYQNAHINIFASQTENCPFILLEALGAGRPLLVSNFPPMPEFCGDAVIYFNPESPAELAQQMEQVLADKNKMEKLAALASERSYIFNWETTAKKTWEAIRSL